jgi:hypothetical protein
VSAFAIVSLSFIAGFVACLALLSLLPVDADEYDFLSVHNEQTNSLMQKCPVEGIDFLTKSVEHVRGCRNPDQ